MITTAVLLAGGLATRLYPLTATLPKSMVDINGKPFISYQLELMKKNGIRTVVVCAGHLGDMIKEYVKDGEAFGITVKYSFDGDKLLGTGGAIKKALPLLGGTFFVMYGDSYLPIDFQKVATFFEQSNKSALMTVKRNNDPENKNNVIFENNTINTYDKKNLTPEMHYVDYGLEIFKATCFSDVRENQVIDLADILKHLVAQRELAGYEVTELYQEIGSYAGLEAAKKYFVNI